MNLLKLKPIEEQTFSLYAFGNIKPKQKTSPAVELTIITKIGKDIKIKATVMQQITGPLQRVPLRLKDQQNLQRTFQLADTLPSQIETYTLGLLIGNDNYYDVMLDERKRIQDNLFVVKSKLGWIMSGRATLETVHHDENTMFVLTTFSQMPTDLHQMIYEKQLNMFEPNVVEDMWNLESIGIKPKDKTERDDLVLEKFQNTFSRR